MASVLRAFFLKLLGQEPIARSLLAGESQLMTIFSLFSVFLSAPTSLLSFPASSMNYMLPSLE